MATDKHTVSIYVDQDLLEKLNEFKTNGEFKSLNVALNSFLRESFLGEVSSKGQSKVSSNVQSTLDINSKINDAVTSAIAPLLARLEALETNRSEATAPEKKLLSLSPNQRERAKQKVKISA